MLIESSKNQSFRDGLADVLRRLRREAGLTQGQLGDKVGLSVGSISRIESGRQQVAVETLQDLGEALGCSAPRLMLEVQRRQPGLSEQDRFQMDVVERMLDLLAAGVPAGDKAAEAKDER